MSIGKVYLIGAGCGEADMITLRGAHLLQSCDVVVYDDLIADELLNLAKNEAEIIYMGKRSGAHSAVQSEINELLIEKAKEGKSVARLKGGDPFVFGRGGEEMQALIDAEIPCEVVSGVTSAIAIAAEAGIPVTHRHLSRSLHIITAHTADSPDGLPNGLQKTAALEGTLVFLMGLRQLPKLAQKLIEYGKAPDTPAAVISGGNSPNPMTIRAPLCEIAEKAKNVAPPAVIVVGEVAKMRLLDAKKPLFGTKIALIGTDLMTKKLGQLLREQGAKSFIAQRSIVKKLPFDVESVIEKGGWLVFTSANGVRAFFDSIKEQKIDLRKLAYCKFAVIGAKTGEKLAEHGILADICPEIRTSEGLAAAISQAVAKGERICVLRSAKGSETLRERLAADYRFEEVLVYDILSDERVIESAKKRLETADYLFFCSAGGVESYFAAHGAIPEKATAVCIGPVAAKALKKQGVERFLLAESISAEGMVEAVIKDMDNKKTPKMS